MLALWHVEVAIIAVQPGIAPGQARHAPYFSRYVLKGASAMKGDFGNQNLRDYFIEANK